MSDLGLVGPAQSDDLFHFTGRLGERPSEVPLEIRAMTPQQRLDAILREEQFRAFAPFGASVPCVCFSESPPDHLAHLIRQQRFSPWGIVGSRKTLLGLQGGSVAYVSDEVYARFKAAGLAHWAVRTSPASTWMHEREWRIPRSDGLLKIGGCNAILIGDINWRPSLVETDAQMNIATGDDLDPSDPAEGTQPAMALPTLWRQSEVWVWDKAAEAVTKYKPGELC
ncbi:hypothetical protein [Streptomyces sp. CBMA156]|uniref:hypothetical protein n=1 Tax=Streptomyces sp. CBMA156 TaxID=1930280 RepID=UPI0016621468|nr:hypothetical protein [Streptomyces sp. CBMA156]